jgi:hypothetical protein
MRVQVFWFTIVFVLAVCLAILSCTGNESAVYSTSGTISGDVRDKTGPVASATVSIQATNNETVTDAEGHFTLTGLNDGIAVTVSAWKHTYYCAKVEEVVPPSSGIILTLRDYQTNDNTDYEWIPPTGKDSCASCKSGVTEIWLENAHAGAATNTRFLTMYNGTDVNGNRSPLTRYGYNRDYGSFPLRPDPMQPYYGPGFKLDFPDSPGNCAACHTPGAAVDAPYDTDPNAVEGADKFGIHCDFCHKVADITLNPADGLPFANMPGVMSMDVRRPFPDDPERYQLFFGTFDDDNVPEEDTYLPLIETSQFCAPCHFGVFWDSVVYNSFGEWLESPYSNPAFEGAQTCQGCHMPAPAILHGEPMTNVAPDKGGVERDPMTIQAHAQLGGMDEVFLQNAVTMTTTAYHENDTITINVEITNDNTGHHIPTDSPLRQLILLVQAESEQGQPLPLLDGAILPSYAGTGDPQDGYYAGLPGKVFSKLLEEMWTEVSPTGAYWNPTVVLSDNRLAAMDTDTSTYVFSLPEEGKSIINVKLLYRRAFKTLMDQKGWNVPDIIVAQESIFLLPDN